MARALTVWALNLWLIPGGVLVVAYIIGEWVSDPERAPRRRLLVLLARLPFAGPLCLFGWPLLAAAVVWQVRQERLRDEVLHGPRHLDAQPPTEAEWRAGRDPARLLAGLSARLDARRRRLIAWACCARLGRHLNNPNLRLAVQRGTASPDGRLSLADHEQTLVLLRELVNQAVRDGALREAAAARACQAALEGDAAAAAYRVRLARGGWGVSRELIGPVRDIVGDPFAPLPPRAFPGELRALAGDIDAGDEALRPLLADALAELGEDAAARHCREPGHCRGCHVLAWVRGGL